MSDESQGIQSTPPETNQSAQEPKFPTTEKSQQEVLSKNKKIPKLAIYVLASIILLALGAFGLWFYQNKIVKQSRLLPPNIISPTPTPFFPPTSETIPPASSKYNTYKDSQYGFEIEYPVSWQINQFTNKDDYYNVVRSGVTLKKEGYEVIITNLGKIPKSGCGSLIADKNNFIKLNVPPVELLRPKIEESKFDGIVAINPQGAEFISLNLGTYQEIQTTAPNTDGSLDCNFLVNNYRYEIVYMFPIIGHENLVNINKETLGEMDGIIASLVWTQ